jgi:hypothetical protein
LLASPHHNIFTYNLIIFSQLHAPSNLETPDILGCTVGEFMITSKLVRPILSTSAAFASLIRPANTPQFHGIGIGFGSGSGSGILQQQQQPVRKMHIQSIPMCMFLLPQALCCTAWSATGFGREKESAEGSAG